MSNEENDKKKENSIYDYNMIFNRIGNNSEDDTKFNTDIINDIDLRNFDSRRYQYYTNLLKIYNADPEILYKLFNKYNSIKYTKENEKKLIRQIYDYAVKYTKAMKEEDAYLNREPFVGGANPDEDNKRRVKFPHVLNMALITRGENNSTTPKSGTTTPRNLLDKRDSVVNTEDVPTPIEQFINSLRRRIERRNIIVNNPNKNEDDIQEIKFVSNEKRDDEKIERGNVEREKEKEKEKERGDIAKQDEEDKKKDDRKIPPTPTDPKVLNSVDNLLKEALELTNEYILYIVPKVDDEVVDEVVDDVGDKKDLLLKETLNISNKFLNTTKGNKNGTEDILFTGSLDLIRKIIKDKGEQHGGVIGDGDDDGDENGYKKTDMPSKYDDDVLKLKYLNTQQYKNIKDDDELEKLRNVQKHRKSKVIQSINTDNKIEQLSNDIDMYNTKIPKELDDDRYIIQQIKNFENDPKNPIEELALTFDDRIVFIIATFFIRYITIIMVQWCIDINIIKTFYEGFIYYAIIYIIIFWFIVLFVNIDNTYDVKYLNFNGVINSIRTLFYYFYMGTNGISRLLIHTSLIIILIVIPIILNIKKNTEIKDDEQNEAIVILAYEERKQLSKSLSLFTMFIWLFTSIIATKF